MRTIDPNLEPDTEREESAPTGQRSPGGRRRPPFWAGTLLIPLGLVAFLGDMRWLLDQPGPTPAPTVAPTTTALPPAISAPTVVPTVQVAAQPAPTLVPTARPTPQPTTAPTRQPTATVVPTATVTETAWWNWQSDQIDPVEAQQVLKAVDNLWYVLAQAWLNLDPTPLDQGFSDPMLAELTQNINERRSQGRASLQDIEHTRTVVRFISNDQAVVYEEYINHSTAIDAVTREPVEERPNDTLKDMDLLRKINGVWQESDVVAVE